VTLRLSASVSQLLLLSTDSNPDQLATGGGRQLGQVELVVVDELDPSVLYVGWRRCHRGDGDQAGADNITFAVGSSAGCSAVLWVIISPGSRTCTSAPSVG